MYCFAGKLSQVFCSCEILACDEGMREAFAIFAETASPLSSPAYTIFWFAMVLLAVGIAVVEGRRLQDCTYFFYAGYVGLIGLMSLSNHVLSDSLRAALGDRFGMLNNFLHLPYAVSYLFFVMSYFRVREHSTAWMRFYSGLLVAYAVALVWLGVDAVRGVSSGHEWGVLACNLVNLVSSLVLGIRATRDLRPGGREFLFAGLPLTASSLVLVSQFLSGGGTVGSSLIAFRTGFILHVMVFMVALSVRYRDMRSPLER